MRKSSPLTRRLRTQPGRLLGFPLQAPKRGMGKLEDMVVQLAGIYGTEKVENPNPVVVIMGADNGVVAEGVSQTGSEVTAQVLENMGERISSVCILARQEGIEVIPVNIGMLTDGKHPRIWNRRRALRHREYCEGARHDQGRGHSGRRYRNRGCPGALWIRATA